MRSAVAVAVAADAENYEDCEAVDAADTADAADAADDVADVDDVDSDAAAAAAAAANVRCQAAADKPPRLSPFDFASEAAIRQQERHAEPVRATPSNAEK